MNKYITTFLKTFTLTLLTGVTLFACFKVNANEPSLTRAIPEGREVDIDYRYAPINISKTSKKKNANITSARVKKKTKISSSAILSGASYNSATGKWVLAADSVNHNQEPSVPTDNHLYLLNNLNALANLDTIATHRKIKVDTAINNGINVTDEIVPPNTPGFPPEGGFIPYDMEGLTFLSAREVLVINEVGNFLFFDVSEDNTLSERANSRLEVPNLKKDQKFSSAAFDGTLIYTANKEGAKDIYVYDKTATPVKNNPIRTLTLAPSIKKELKPGRDLDEYTISGMFYYNDSLFIMSEAYSTVFIANPNTAVITGVIAIENADEISGMAIKKNRLYLIGDAEDYIPTVYIYEVPIPKQFLK
ncbi:hypothetical protein COTS27_00250 [Spirochaetota bacterium]|nr:hypothetical protein COTS27_00250 [Spirochaetota bacterium]